MPTYSYDPGACEKANFNRMRLELGDTTFAPGELTAALCDEEYTYFIDTFKSWKKAKLACLRAILMKYSHQVNTSVDGLSYSFSDRVKFWKQLYDELKGETLKTVPKVDSGSLTEINGGHYFRKDIMKNL